MREENRCPILKQIDIPCRYNNAFMFKSNLIYIHLVILIYSILFQLNNDINFI
jgi:hypothetical protein